MPSTTDTALVGQILRDARKQAGLSQEDVAAAFGWRQNRVSKFELGQVSNPSMRVLVRFSEVLGIELESLAAPFRSAPLITDRKPRRRSLQQVAS